MKVIFRKNTLVAGEHVAVGETRDLPLVVARKLVFGKKATFAEPLPPPPKPPSDALWRNLKPDIIRYE